VAKDQRTIEISPSSAPYGPVFPRTDCVAENQCQDTGPNAQETDISAGDPLAPTDDSAAAGKFWFLDPPREPGELGWLHHYRVLKLLGKGGMGLVFLAEDPRLKRAIAIKVMRPELAENLVSRQRFLREARATAAISSEHIVAVHDIGQSKEIPYVATDLLRGSSFDAYLKEKRWLTVLEVVHTGLQIAQGLEAAHKLGLIHRDIKPSNIWVEEGTHRIKLLDFGLARAADRDTNLTECGAVVGTALYMAPEQASGREVDCRSDLFSLGCVLYEAASGRNPFDGNSNVAPLFATALVDPLPLKDVASAMPADLCGLIMQLLEKDRALRPASATEVIERLRGISTMLTSPPPTQPSGSRPQATRPLSIRQRKPRRRLVSIGLGLVGVLAGALGLAFLLRGGSDRQASRETGPIQVAATEDLVFGMSAPFTGPARELGRDMKLGIETCFHETNEHGGVGGRKLRLLALDDGYQPDRALENMKRLYENDHVFGVIGNVGTPTAEQTVPYALSKKILFFGGFTGAPLLRADPPDRYVFNYRASYAEETAAIVKYLMTINRIAAEEIAVFAQRDGYGDAGFNGVAKVLRQHGRQPEQILRVGYARNSAQVEEAVQTILAHKEIRAVVMVATYHAAAQFIQQTKNANGRMCFANVSFVGTDALADDLRQMGPGFANGVIVTQVVPHPASHASVVLKFQEALSQYDPSEQPRFVSLEGYIDARILVEGLRRSGTTLTTETLVEALESINGLDIGLGVPLSFGPSEHQALHKVWGSVFDTQGKLQVLPLE